MLEGKMPMDATAILMIQQQQQQVGGGENGPIIQERIVYRDKDGDNKENNAELEEELRNKETELKNEQEEKRILQ